MNQLKRDISLMEIDLSTLPVQCPVCEKDMLRLNREHALEHGYKSLTQYRKKNSLNYLTLQQRSKEDFKRLYNIDFKRWVVGYHASEGMRYVTKIYDPEIIEYTRSGSKFPINDGTFYAHMSGQNPLAVFAFGTHSRYFTFDIDSEDQAKSDALKLIKQLQDHGIDRNDIHISFSGGKGYHISLFIDQHIKFKDWEMFAKYIKYKAGLTSADIEHRPIESNGLALKLPLTLHPKTKNFAGFCDIDTFEVYGIMESHNYLHTIEQMDTEKVIDVIRKAKRYDAEVKAAEQQQAEEQREKAVKESKQAVKIRDVDLFQSSEEKAETAKRLLIHGLPGKGRRWLAMRDTLIPYLKIQQGNDPERTAAILRDWTQKEIERGNVGTPYEECERQIDELIKSWYPQVTDFYAVVRDIEITKAEIDWVMSVIETGGTRNARDLLWVLLLLSKAYKERVKRMGTFFASRKQLQDLLSKPNRISPATIQKQRQWLVEHDYLTFEVPPNAFTRRLAAVYKLSDIDELTPDVIDSVTFTDKTDGRKLLKDISKKLYTPKALKRFKID